MVAGGMAQGENPREIAQDVRPQLDGTWAVYSEWFDQADEKRRRLAVGPRRYQAVTDLLGGTRPSWAHFVNPDSGEMMPLDVLTQETHEERHARIVQVNRAVGERKELIAQTAMVGFVKDQPPHMPVKFTSRVSAKAWAQENFQQWKDGLSKRQSQAIKDYKRGGFSTVNAYLRKGTSDLVDELRANEIIPQLDAAMASTALPSAVVVYRFIDNQNVLQAFDNLAGLTIRDPGCSSTSLTAHHPEERAKEKEGIIAAILVPQGTPAMYLDMVLERNEQELLLAKGLALRVTKVWKAGSQRYLAAEVVS